MNRQIFLTAGLLSLLAFARPVQAADGVFSLDNLQSDQFDKQSSDILTNLGIAQDKCIMLALKECGKAGCRIDTSEKIKEAVQAAKAQKLPLVVAAANLPRNPDGTQNPLLDYAERLAKANGVSIDLRTVDSSLIKTWPLLYNPRKTNGGKTSYEDVAKYMNNLDEITPRAVVPKSANQTSELAVIDETEKYKLNDTDLVDTSSPTKTHEVTNAMDGRI